MTHQLNYEPGELKAEPDKVCLTADNEDLSFITVKLVDHKGSENLYESRKIHVRVEGEGVLQGFGNADPQSTGSYDGYEWETYDGYVMAVI